MARKTKKTRDQQSPRMGRPSLYKPEYCEQLIQHMEWDGKSFESFAAAINVGIRTLYVWEKEYPEFLQAKEIGMAKAQAYWEEIGATNVHSPSNSWSPTPWMFIMRCRFKYRDGYDPMKRKLVDGDDSPPAAETDAEQIEKLAEEIAILAQNAKGR